MKIIHLKAFSIIGKEGSNETNKDIVPKLFSEANLHFNEISHLIKRDKDGNICSMWGAMSSLKRDLSVWEDNFSIGLYLAGVETEIDTIPPIGWVKWNIPERDYFVKEVEDMSKYKDVFFTSVYFEIPYNRYSLIGAAFDFTDLKTNKNYIYFPVVKKTIKIYEESTKDKIAICGCHCSYCFFDECGGCGSENDFCSMAAFEDDKICPNVKCVKEKGLKGCYECRELDKCNIGIFKSPNSLKASCIFIKMKGLKAFDEVIKEGCKMGKNYSKDFVDSYETIEEQLHAFYSVYKNIKSKS